MILQNAYQQENKISPVNRSINKANGEAAGVDVLDHPQLPDYAAGLMDAVRDLLLITDADGRIVNVNEVFVKIIGSPRKAIIGTRFQDHFIEFQRVKEIYQTVLAKGAVADNRLTLCNLNGKLVDVLFSAMVFKNESGGAKGLIVILKDISYQKKLESELVEARADAKLATQRAEESTKLKEAFLANMSHEIRTPLNAIIGFSDILSRKKLGKKQSEQVKTIKSAGESLLVIINDILDISKIEAGMMTFEKNNFNVRDVLDSVKRMLAEKAKEKNLELLFCCDPDVPEVLLGDPTRLAQVLINLTGNAIKFTHRGKVDVRVKPVAIKNENIFIEFLVADTGIGIPEDKLHFVFERFRQAESHTTRKYGGSGLGLSIAKQLVELQKGTLSVKSKLHTGSVFSFCIPYQRPRTRQPVPESVEIKYNIKDLAQLKILLVEDNRLNVLLILNLFAENKLKLEVVENGSECIEKIKENNFDIILMDMEMPVMNGYETTTIIREQLKSNIPIIAMTAHAMAGEREKCLSLGMNDYISKPINANMLFEKMLELTHKRDYNGR